MQHQDSSDPTGVSNDYVNHRGHTNPQNATRARTRKSHAAISMRIAGATWTEIALALGYPTARAALVATEKALEKELHDTDREHLRRLAGARLDRLLRSVWGKAIDDKSPEQMVAVSRARDLVADHRKLFGLDAPTEIVVHNPTQAEIEAWVASVVSVRATVDEYDILDDGKDGTYALPAGS